MKTLVHTNAADPQLSHVTMYHVVVEAYVIEYGQRAYFDNRVVIRAATQTLAKSDAIAFVRSLNPNLFAPKVIDCRTVEDVCIRDHVDALLAQETLTLVDLDRFRVALLALSAGSQRDWSLRLSEDAHALSTKIRRGDDEARTRQIKMFQLSDLAYDVAFNR